MKAIVEWGIPKTATTRKICGISGQAPALSPRQASKLASQLFHTMTEGAGFVADVKAAWGVSKSEPRKIVWSQDNTVWVAVSLLDDVARGAYAGVADREHQARTTQASN
jgi:hypothetical protein